MKKNQSFNDAQATDLARYFLGDVWVASSKRPAVGLFAEAQYILSRSDNPGLCLYSASSWREVFRLAGVKLPARPQFVQLQDRVVKGSLWIATACSNRYARRIAECLNAAWVTDE